MSSFRLGAKEVHFRPALEKCASIDPVVKHDLPKRDGYDRTFIWCCIRCMDANFNKDKT